MTRRGICVWAVGVAVLLVTCGLAFRTWAIDHVRQVTGRHAVDDISCSRCHGAADEPFTWEREHARHPRPAGLAVTADGTRVIVACAGTDEVLAVDPATARITARAAVEAGPFAVALEPGGTRIAVACREADRIQLLRLPGLEPLATIPVGRGPVSLAWCRRGEALRIVVANSASDDVSLVDAGKGVELCRLPAGREPFALTASADGSRVVVANRLARLHAGQEPPASEITVLDPWVPDVPARAPLRSAHLAEGCAIVPGRGLALVPCVRVRNLLPIVQVAGGWVMSSALAVYDMERDQVVQLPLDEANAYFADPGQVVVTPSGRRAFVASGGADIVSVIDVEALQESAAGEDDAGRAADDLQRAARYVEARIPTGPNPRHLALAPDGGRLYVAEHLGDALLVVDAERLEVLRRIEIPGAGGSDAVWRGARVFHSASTAFQGQFSCRSCHPGGHVDGLVYDFDIDGLGRNLVDNRSLAGVGGTAPFKWNGKNPSLEVQCGMRFARVLTRTDPIEGAQLDDLVAYIRSLPPVRPPAGLDAAAVKRGKRLFFATRSPDGTFIPPSARCSTCHPPPHYTNGLKAAVGTRAVTDDAEAFDVPHLMGIAASAPYLHDGRAASLEEIWTVFNSDDLHGVTSTLNKHDLNDLVEFLRSL